MLVTLAAVVTVVAVMSTPTLEGGHVVVSNNAAAMVTASGSAANGRTDEVNECQQMMQHPAFWKKRSAIKTEPVILVFRRSSRY